MNGIEIDERGSRVTKRGGEVEYRPTYRVTCAECGTGTTCATSLEYVLDMVGGDATTWVCRRCVSRAEWDQKSDADVLRKLAAMGQYGHARKPDGFYPSQTDLGRYGDILDRARFERIVALSKRYRSFVHYCREIAPEWVEVDRTYWADNSIDSIQRSKTGETRRVMVKGPSGDACY